MTTLSYEPGVVVVHEDDDCIVFEMDEFCIVDSEGYILDGRRNRVLVSDGHPIHEDDPHADEKLAAILQNRDQARGVVGTLGDRARDRLGQQRDIFPDFSSPGKGQS